MTSDDRERPGERRFQEVTAKLTIGQRCSGRIEGDADAEGARVYLLDVAYNKGFLPRTEFVDGDDRLTRHTKVEVYVVAFDHATLRILLTRRSPQQSQADARATDRPTANVKEQQGALVPSLLRVLSRDRLEVFRLDEKDDDTSLLARYLWDADMAAALWPLL